MDTEVNSTYFEDVDHLLWWASTLDTLDPECKYTVLRTGREKLLENASVRVITAYDMLLKNAYFQADPSYTNIFLVSLKQTFGKHRFMFIFTTASVVVSTLLGIFNIGRYLSEHI